MYDKFQQYYGELPEIIHDIKKYTEERNCEKLKKYFMGANDAFSNRISIIKNEIPDEDISLNEIFTRFFDDLTVTAMDYYRENFNLNVPDYPINIKGNKISIISLVCNVADNAYKCAEQKNGKAAKVNIDVKKEAGNAVITIEDNGSGMDAVTLKNIQKPFYTTGGTGVGLTEAFLTVKDHGGTIEVESELGKGTKFVVTLPLAPVSVLADRIAEGADAQKELNPEVPYVAAFGGAAGVGKTELLQKIKIALKRNGKNALEIGMDDFYHPPPDRGKEFGPGWLRLDEARDFMRRVKSGEKKIRRLRYDRDVWKEKQELVDEIVDLEGIDVVLFEGLYVIAEDDHTGNFLEFVDFPVYMKANLEHIRQWKSEQEKTRPYPRSEEDLDIHWKTELMPDFQSNILPSKKNAKYIINVDFGHRIASIIPGEQVADNTWRLINNPWIKNFINRSNTPDIEEMMSIFLTPDHIIKKEAFYGIDSLSDAEVLNELNKRIIDKNEYKGLSTLMWSKALGRHLTLRELFLNPSSGLTTDLYQAITHKLLFTVRGEEIDLLTGQGRVSNKDMKAKIETAYLLLKGIEISSKKQDLTLVQHGDVGRLVNYLIIEEAGYSSSAANVKDAAENLLSYADLIISYDTPQKQESLKNLLAIMAKLQKNDKWREVLSKEEYQHKISEIKEIVGEVLMGEELVEEESPEEKAERIQAIRCTDNVKLIADKKVEEPTIIALGTNWIKGYERGGPYYDELNEIVVGIRQYCTERGIAFVDRPDEKLLAGIGAAKVKIIKNNKSINGNDIKVITIADVATVTSTGFKDLANASLYAVDNRNLDIRGYIALLETLRRIMEHEQGRHGDNTDENVTILKVEGETYYLVTPNAKLIKYDDINIKLLYKAQLSA